jgi:hypothetical protein
MIRNITVSIDRVQNMFVVKVIKHSYPCLMLILCIIRRIRIDKQYALIVPLRYSTYRFLYVSAGDCYHQGSC